MSNEPSHHIAWADRLNLNKIWSMAINDCRITYGSEEYRRAVYCLQNLLIDIQDGPALRSEVDAYKNGPWEDLVKQRLAQWRRKNPYQQYRVHSVQFAEEQIRADLLEDLFKFIVQKLENSGLGFYRSTEITHGSDGYRNQDDNNDEIV